MMEGQTMIKVANEAEFEQAVNGGATHMLAMGGFARQIRRREERKSTVRKTAAGVGIGAGLLAIGGLIAAPLTGGSSLLLTGGVLSTAVATGAMASTIAVSATELIALTTCAVCLGAYLANRKITLKLHSGDSDVEIIICDKAS